MLFVDAGDHIARLVEQALGGVEQRGYPRDGREEAVDELDRALAGGEDVTRAWDAGEVALNPARP